MKNLKSEYLVNENIGLVHLCAKKFLGRNIDYEDIFQAGCLGLTKAAERFDESRGFKFSTYAVPVIIGEIKGLFRYGTEIKIPRETRKTALELMKISENFEKTYGRAPTVSELSKLTDISSDEVERALCAVSPVISSDEENFEAFILKSESYEEELTEKLALKEIYEGLKYEEKELLYLRFKLNKTQSETAKIFGVSQMQISRREKKILLYIRGVLSE